MNKVFLVGRAASEPQGSVTSTGSTLSRISIACQDTYNKNEVYFFPCVAWQNNAKFINTYVKKGDLIAIDGKLRRGSYVNKEGQKVYTTDVVIENVKIMSSANQNRTNNFSASEETYNNKPSYQNNTNEELVFEDNSIESDNQEELDTVDLDWLNEID